MILTNPTEFDRAIEEQWKRVDEIRNARKIGKADVVYADANERPLPGECKRPLPLRNKTAELFSHPRADERVGEPALKEVGPQKKRQRAP